MMPGNLKRIVCTQLAHRANHVSLARGSAPADTGH